MYNRATRIHKAIYEALMRLAWQEFMPWVEKNLPEKLHLITIFLDKFPETGYSEEQWNDLLVDSLFTEVQLLWKTFLHHLRYENGDFYLHFGCHIKI